ncbi:hypothetical protein J2T02_002509 [Chitinophaga terrae (ex Kim and Jung 2007)]|nr:hypothetical protein [Chitinophaga terrae (ex Kim and Jung 2007)]MDQ0107390.1 hypothetical protein [Chitinophaga terrae (ex Kim and Jung 2007)]GEP88795.1 hypothetical protein CTE07_04400 [Chitinophaga terrae (ex Kim and Jung 2007)]
MFLHLTNAGIMGLFNFFKKPLRINDEFFGPLRYIEIKGARGYFEGKGLFAPLGYETEYLIEAETSGPAEWQKEFYKNLQLEFDGYIEKIKPLITDELREEDPDIEIGDFKDEFTLVNITIPFSHTPVVRWNMAFTTIHEADHYVTVEFSGDEPVEAVLE